MADELVMELRTVTEPERLIIGVVAPYDETTYLVADPRGERIRRGAFARSIENHGRSKRGIGLYRNHHHEYRLGVARRLEDGPDGLVAEFVVNPGELGDQLLAECRDGYYGGLSAGWRAIREVRGADGAREVVEAALGEVSMVGLPAYVGAGLLEVRGAQDLATLLAPFTNRPAVNLEPIPPILTGVRR